MFIILPCPTIQDKVSLLPVGEAASQIPQMDKIRNQIRKLSDTTFLVESLQKGEVIMGRKINFDSYLRSHVDLMRSYVNTFTPCKFIYNSFFSFGDINTSAMSPKEQWAFEIVMSRYNLCSIYHGGSYANMAFIFSEMTNSYLNDYKKTSELMKNVQVAFQYFNEGYQPLKRLLPVFDAVEALVSQPMKEQYPEVNKGMFEVFASIIQCNVAYLKIQKYRLLGQYRSAKEAAYAVYLRMCDIKSKLNPLGQKYSIGSDLLDFLELTQLFYQIIAYYLMILEHEVSKEKEEYGFIKKEFQQLILDNLVIMEEIQKLSNKLRSQDKENDNFIYGMKIIGVILVDVAKFRYRYNVNIHENKTDKSSIQEVVARRIGSSTIWNCLENF